MATISYPDARFKPAEIVVKPHFAVPLFGGLLLLNLVVILFLDDALVVVLTDLITPLVGLIATGFLFYTTWKIRPVSPGFARAWLFLALGCLAWALADVIWAVLEVFLHVEPFPSLADFFYLLYYPLVIVGFLVIPHVKRSLKERHIMGLDLSIVFLAAGLLYWNFLIGPLTVFEEVDWLSFLISLAYPIFDLVLFAALMLLIYRRQKLLSLPAQLWLMASIGIQIFADTIYGMQSIAGTYVSGTILDISWQVGFAAFGLAGIYQLQSMVEAPGKREPETIPLFRIGLKSWLGFLPYLWLAAAYGLLIYSQYYVLPMSPRTIAEVIGVMIALVLIRQITSILDITKISEQLNVELTERRRVQELLNKSNEELEQRVSQRTVELMESNRQLMEEVAERQQAESRLESSLHEKEVLLKEVHHRVKNNLQVISSMLKLQARHINDPAVMTALTDSQNRVQTMALIHEKLYQSVNLADIDFAGYLDNLLSYLNRSYNSAQKQVSLRLQTEAVFLNIDQAIPCGLIVNELFSNALKYAFPNGNGGEIAVHLKADEDERVVLVVADNGVGIPAEIAIQNSSSLGLKLVNALVEQLDGEMQYDATQGTRFTISFSKTPMV
jgi:two-component sensor histidine kinase